ncbi:hypothetical protein J6590_021326 [Homalodisca vitripennis]|nr:hypothetical protein J6590_021326 [Homalodisca vitripennis]
MHQDSVSLLQPTVLVLRVCGVCPSALRTVKIHFVTKIYAFVLAITLLVFVLVMLWTSFGVYNDITAFIFFVSSISNMAQHVILLTSPFLTYRTLSRFFMIMESAQQTLFDLNIRQPPNPSVRSQICWMALMFAPGCAIFGILCFNTSIAYIIPLLIENLVTVGTACKMRVLFHLVNEKFGLLNWHLDDLNNRWPLFLPRPADVSFRELPSVALWRRKKFVLPSHDTRTVTAEKIRNFNKAHLKLYYAYRTLNSLFYWPGLIMCVHTGTNLVYITFLLFSTVGGKRFLTSVIFMLNIANRILSLGVMLTMTTKIEEKSRRTALLVHDLLDEDGHSSEVLQELETFSLALLHRKGNFSAAGFFDMNLKLISRVPSRPSNLVGHLHSERMLHDDDYDAWAFFEAPIWLRLWTYPEHHDYSKITFDLGIKRHRLTCLTGSLYDQESFHLSLCAKTLDRIVLETLNMMHSEHRCLALSEARRHGLLPDPMGLHTTPTCKYRPDKIYNADHTFFECARWIGYRSTTEEIISTRLSPSSQVAYMIKKEENWPAFKAYVQRLLKDKIAERQQ